MYDPFPSFSPMFIKFPLFKAVDKIKPLLVRKMLREFGAFSTLQRKPMFSRLDSVMLKQRAFFEPDTH